MHSFVCRQKLSSVVWCAALFTSQRQSQSGDLLPPVVCLEVATPIDEMDFSTSKVRVRRVVEEENSTLMNSHLAVIVNILMNSSWFSS
ncbi:hypothetical protein llap_9833 [Limosa lapponica baueri]|uniref:Uncharacterized protein n=1 Tax=Limosa lapponica baueri TaxID=1758121 RepID=A0A2I0U1A0_LIMLA|nr:hypothetical protein llap_9833 [Limosa lapponica baueri]